MIEKGMSSGVGDEEVPAKNLGAFLGYEGSRGRAARVLGKKAPAVLALSSPLCFRMSGEMAELQGSNCLGRGRGTSNVDTVGPL